MNLNVYCYSYVLSIVFRWFKTMKIRFIIFLVFTKCQTVASQSKLVVHTTCLELAKPSNQHLRMTCSDSTEYHCLLDETFTKEFEVCKKWKWISKGKSRQLAFIYIYILKIKMLNMCDNLTIFCFHEKLHFLQALHKPFEQR